MVKQTGTHKVTVDRLVVVEPPIVPTVVFNQSASGISEEAETGTPVAMTLSSVLGEHTPILFELDSASTAELSQDYDLTRAADPQSQILIPDPVTGYYTLWILSGNVDAAFYVTPKQDDKLTEITESVILNIVAPASGSTYAAGTAMQTHTVSITSGDPLTDPVVNWSAAESSVVEGDATPGVAMLRLDLGRPADGGETIDVTINAATTASLGADYVAAPTLPATITFPAGEVYQEIAVTCVHDLIDDADVTLVLDIGNPTDLTVGPITQHELTIRDDDITYIDPVVQWDVLAESASEGSATVSYGITETGGNPHQGIMLEVSVNAATTAAPTTDYVFESSQTLYIPAGTGGTAAVEVSYPLNSGEHVNSVLALDLAIDLGTVTSVTKTITVINTTEADLGVDGDLTDYLGARLAPERVPFDPYLPDLKLFTDGVVVVGYDSNGALDESLDVYHLVSASNFNTQSVMDKALQLADAMWAVKNPLVTRSTVLMGEEHNTIKISCFGWKSDTTDPRQLGESAGDKQFNFNDSLNSAWSEDQTDCRLYPKNGGANSSAPCIRDLIFYGLDPEFPTIMAGINFAHDEGLVDNVRFENLRFQPKHYVKAPVLVAREIVYGTPQGRIKLYDCSGKNLADPDTGGYEWGNAQYPRASKWGLRAEGRASWDIRVRPGAPYPFADSVQEHYIYVDSPVGDLTYPAMRVTAIADGTLTECGNYFIGVTGEAAQPPWRTAIQVASRRLSNPGDIGSGDLVFIRCTGQGVGGEEQDGGQGFSVWGHGSRAAGVSRVYFKDCAYVQGNHATAMGGLGLLSEQSWASGDPAAHGQEVIEVPTSSGYLYQIDTVVVDGFTYNVNSQGTQSRDAMKFYGVRNVVLVKFLLTSGGSWNQINMNSYGVPGLGFTETFDTSNLVYPDHHAQAGEDYDGDFTDYPGFAGGNSRMIDGYFMNWWADTTSSGDGAVDLDDDAKDNYQSIVTEQKARRFDTADLSGAVGAHWPATAPQTPNPQDFPEPRLPSTLVSYMSGGAGVTHTVRADCKYSFSNEVRIFHQRGAASTESSLVTLDPAATLTLAPSDTLLQSPWSAANAGDNGTLSYDDITITMDGGSAPLTGSTSKTYVVEMSNGAIPADYEFPQSSGTRVTLSAYSVAQTEHLVTIVPTAGMHAVSWATSTVSQPYPASASTIIPVTVNRADVVGSANADGDKFDAVFTITSAVSRRLTGFDFVESDGDDLDVANTYTIPSGESSVVVYMSNFTTNPSELVGYAMLTLVADVTTFSNLGPIPLCIVTLSSSPL